MRKKQLALFLGVCLLAALVSPLVAWAAPESVEEPVVRAVMFWMDGCPHCHDVIDKVLPPLEAQYADQFQIELIELKTIEDFDRLAAVAQTYGVTKDQVGVPFLIIGDRVLIGSGQIPAELPGLIESHLAAGGVDYPAVPGFQELLPASEGDGANSAPVSSVSEGASVSVEATQPAAPVQQEKFDGYFLGVIVMAGLVAALIYAGVVFVLGSGGLPDKSWIDLALPVLAILGIGVALYLSYIETQSVQAICGPVGDCNAVQSSQYAYLFGVIPVGGLGLVGFLAILAAWFVRRRATGRTADYATLALFGMALFGVLFSIYLTFLELFVIFAVCIWCLSSAVITTLILVLSVGPAAAWLNKGET